MILIKPLLCLSFFPLDSFSVQQVLLQLGCELAQGFGIARPMVGDEMAQWVACWRIDPSWAGVLRYHCQKTAASTAFAASRRFPLGLTCNRASTPIRTP